MHGGVGEQEGEEVRERGCAREKDGLRKRWWGRLDAVGARGVMGSKG